MIYSIDNPCCSDTSLCCYALDWQFSSSFFIPRPKRGFYSQTIFLAKFAMYYFLAIFTWSRSRSKRAIWYRTNRITKRKSEELRGCWTGSSSTLLLWSSWPPSWNGLSRKLPWTSSNGSNSRTFTGICFSLKVNRRPERAIQSQYRGNKRSFLVLIFWSYFWCWFWGQFWSSVLLIPTSLSIDL